MAVHGGEGVHSEKQSKSSKSGQPDCKLGQLGRGWPTPPIAPQVLVSFKVIMKIFREPGLQNRGCLSFFPWGLGLHDLGTNLDVWFLVEKGQGWKHLPPCTCLPSGKSGVRALNPGDLFSLIRSFTHASVSLNRY